MINFRLMNDEYCYQAGFWYTEKDHLKAEEPAKLSIGQE